MLLMFLHRTGLPESQWNVPRSNIQNAVNMKMSILYCVLQNVSIKGILIQIILHYNLLQKHKINSSNDRQQSTLTLMIHVNVSYKNQRWGTWVDFAQRCHNTTQLSLNNLYIYKTSPLSTAQQLCLVSAYKCSWKGKSISE